MKLIRMSEIRDGLVISEILPYTLITVLFSNKIPIVRRAIDANWYREDVDNKVEELRPLEELLKRHAKKEVVE
jgi:hypothetical protein